VKVHVTTGEAVGETVIGAPQSTVKPVAGFVVEENATDPEKPFRLLTVILLVPVPPDGKFTVAGTGLLSEKSPTFTLIGAR
jgi:hypothetical protein